MQIKISEIKINPGRRDTQQRNVEELARSIAAVGLMNPITVTQDNTLIAGLHRLEAVKLSEDTADKLGVSKRTVERLVQTAANLTPEAKKIIRDAGDKISRDAALKISRLPPDQQEEAAAVLTVAPPSKKKTDTADLESLLKEFKAHAQRFISGMTAFDQQADTFARMSYVQSNELWNSAVAVTDVIRAFSKKVNHIKDKLQGDHSHEN